jgi:ribosomal protein S27AE
MMCPRCGIAMNHHAEKLIEPRSAAEAKHVDAALGGLVEEMHTCPGCGGSGSRLAT